MGNIERIAPERAREKVESEDALLVCAYENDEKCENLRINGSLSLSEFRAKISGIANDREIIFF